MTTYPKVDLTAPIYHDDNVAREHLEALLWPNGPRHPPFGINQPFVWKGMNYTLSVSQSKADDSTREQIVIARDAAAAARDAASEARIANKTARIAIAIAAIAAIASIVALFLK